MFDNCNACCNMCFVDDEVGISACLSTRFNEPCSPIRDVISIHNCVSMLHHLAMYCGVAKNRRLATYCWFGRSPKDFPAFDDYLRNYTEVSWHVRQKRAGEEMYSDDEVHCRTGCCGTYAWCSHHTSPTTSWLPRKRNASPHSGALQNDTGATFARSPLGHRSQPVRIRRLAILANVGVRVASEHPARPPADDVLT